MGAGREGFIEYVCSQYNTLRRIIVLSILAIFVLLPSLFVETSTATDVILLMNFAGFGAVLAIVIPLFFLCYSRDS
jgi:multidrug efflux pump subunit AcrB